MQTHPKREVEKCIGDGNCAFNAFIMALADPKVLLGIESRLSIEGKLPDKVFKDFIREAAKALDVGASWVAVKKKLSESVTHIDRIELQENLAPVMRTLAIAQAEKTNIHSESTNQPFLAAFANYFTNYVNKSTNNKSASADDIFLQHPFIENYFQNLCEKLPKKMNEIAKIVNLETCQQQALAWWRETGYKQFMQGMSKDKKWAGDLELAPLARYFHINLFVSSKRFEREYSAHSDNGKFRTRGFSDEITSDLAIRGVIDPLPRDGVRPESTAILINSRHTLLNRLSQVPNFNQVLDILNENKKKFDDQERKPAINRSSVTFEVKLSQLSEECREELTKRGMGKENENTFTFTLEASYQKALSRIDAIKDFDKVHSELTSQLKRQPKVVLSNQSGTHWNNMRLPAIANKIEVNSGMEKMYRLLVDPNVQPKPPDDKQRVSKSEKKPSKEIPAPHSQSSVAYETRGGRKHRH